MEAPPTPDHDILALPARAQLVRALGELRRPGTTQELADRVGRHPNTVRTQLQILADAGLLERRTAQRRRGRPRCTTRSRRWASRRISSRTAPDRPPLVLRNCPYREAVRENQAAICRLHKGITAGLLDRLDPHAKLSGFVPKDPYAAGCIIALEGVSHAEIA
ncbi:MAG: helix-turn-helix domain-containing protein [Solirubrobacteraceae bacterium]